MLAHEVLCLRSRTADPAAFTTPLVARGWQVHEALDANGVRQTLARHPVLVGLLWCQRWDDGDLARLQGCLAPELEWVGVFDAGAFEQAGVCEWVLACFFDHLRLPVDVEDLDRTLHHALARGRLRARSLGGPHPIEELGMVGQSPAMQRLRQQLRKVAATDAPVLLGGESGSGKELAARAIHQGSRRAAQPFVAVNCGAIAPTLIQSELFGHERGAFTGATTTKPGLIEAAHHGTIFLDEIG
ncbi:MAG TPA: sigma 54-interacting transcriptional regulator, partial [Aquabacterium sp.]|nr:sigma 54-interacting transcriptional regulator [Aquabacterium sp.]